LGQGQPVADKGGRKPSCHDTSAEGECRSRGAVGANKAAANFAQREAPAAATPAREALRIHPPTDVESNGGPSEEVGNAIKRPIVRRKE
jgi:hypothetical protein